MLRIDSILMDQHETFKLRGLNFQFALWQVGEVKSRSPDSVDIAIRVACFALSSTLPDFTSTSILPSLSFCGVIGHLYHLLLTMQFSRRGKLSLSQRRRSHAIGLSVTGLSRLLRRRLLASDPQQTSKSVESQSVGATSSSSRSSPALDLMVSQLWCG